MNKILAILAISVLGAAGLVASVASTAVATPNLVTICHYDHGGEPHTIAVNENAVDAHLNPQGNGVEHRGDYLGPCQGDTTDTTGTTGEEPDDLCPNLQGVQETVPSGYTLVEGACVPVVITETTVTTPTTPTNPGCPNGQPGGAGKDGEPGNDDCAPPPPPTETTPTTDTTPTTPTDTTPTTPETTPTDPEATPDPAPEEPTLEEELEEQAKQGRKNELAAGRNPDRVHNASASSLPHTGFPVWVFMILGATLVGAGTVLVRR